MRDLARRAMDRLGEEAPAAKRRLFLYAREEPEPNDVAVHPDSGRYHDPAHVDGEAVRYTTENVASTVFEECPHCSPQGRRTVIRGSGGGR